MTSENGEAFIRNLAQFVRTHEKALANALQSQSRTQKPRSTITNTHNGELSPSLPNPSLAINPTPPSNTFASAFSLGSLSFTSHAVKPAKLTLTPHHLFYLLSKFEDLGVEIGAMNVRIENIHTSQSPANYVSFLSQPTKPKGRSDRDSVHSVSSIRSVMSTMTSFWSSLGIGAGSGAAKTEKALAQLRADTKYLYSAFTKIPCLRLSPDHRARLISGYEEFPFDTAVPLWAFKNMSALEIYDLDFRQFFGWDRLSEQLRSLTIKRGNVEDPLDLIVHIVLDDMDKRRRRSSKPQSPPTPLWPSSPVVRNAGNRNMSFSTGTPESPFLGNSVSPRETLHQRGYSEILVPKSSRNKSNSPTRPTSARQNSFRHVKTNGERMRRSGSASSHSSGHSLSGTSGHRSSSNLLSMGILPASKWRFLRHLSLADNSLTTLNATGLAPLANTLQSLDLSSNLFTEVPDCLALLTALRSLNMSNCMIESLHSFAKNPLPAITAFSLNSNRLTSLAGIERLFSLERLDVRENKVSDPMEFARLTGIPEIRDIFVVGNPLTKLHSNYRVTVFNLFRSAPGYTEDITIDSSLPGYSERRQLKDRVAEPAAVPIIKIPTAAMESSTTGNETAKIPSNITSRVITGDRPIPHATQSEAVVGSSRRKKSTKRRIVDLSNESNSPSRIKRPSIDGSLSRHIINSPKIDLHDNNDDNDDGNDHPMEIQTSSFPTIQPSPSMLEDDPFVSTPTKAKTVRIITEHSTSFVPAAHAARSQVSDSALVNELENLKLEGDDEAYQRRLELLRAQFGPGWLPTSKENLWSSSNSTGSVTTSHPSAIRSPSHGTVVSSGRTLG